MEAHGWKRAFCGRSGKWGDTSPATILPSDDPAEIVEGLAVAMTHDEIARLDPFEGYPTVYDKK